MKSIIPLIKRWLRNSQGLTLLELTIAMAVGSFVMGGVFTVYTQLFDVTATNSNYMAAFRQAQNGGAWITHDALMTQGVYDMPTTPPTLSGDISAADTVITVSSTTDFPPSGVICIEDEIIFYADKTATTFGTAADPVTRSADATAHTNGADVTFFVHLSRTDWDGNQHQVIYNLRENRQLVRTHYMHDKDETDPNIWILQSSTIVAEAIDGTATTSNYSNRELEVQITANVGGYILGRQDEQSFAAKRTYKIHPRPLF